MSDAQDDTDNAPDGQYDDPELAINRVYTRRGDEGTTQLVGGQTVDKSDKRIEAYGTVDELNAHIGKARQIIVDDYHGKPAYRSLSDTLLRVQHELFNLGSILATKPEDVGEQMPRVTDDDVEALEESIDTFNENLPELRSFVLPGGTELNAELHVCRTVCRRAERATVKLARDETIESDAISYLNRLSDALFVWARWSAVHPENKSEVLWEPNRSTSGSKPRGDDHE